MAQVELEVYQEVEDDLTLEVYDFRDSMQVNIKFLRSAFFHHTARRFLEGFQSLLSDVVERPDSPLADLEVLDESHRWLLVNQLSGANRPGEEVGDLLLQIDRWADSYPDSAALVFQGQVTTFAELRRSSLELAAELERQGVRPGDVVGLQLPRSAEFINGILGVLRVGGGFTDRPRDVRPASRRSLGRKRSDRCPRSFRAFPLARSGRQRPRAS